MHANFVRFLDLQWMFISVNRKDVGFNRRVNNQLLLAGSASVCLPVWVCVCVCLSGRRAMCTEESFRINQFSVISPTAHKKPGLSGKEHEVATSNQLINFHGWSSNIWL